MGIIPEGCQLEEISGENEMKLLKRSKQTDILKGIAIILILTTHFHWPDSYRMNPVFPFIIEMAVPVFMVLSGYTWSLSYERNGDSISEVYALRNIIKKILRFTIPYIPVIAAEGYIQMKSGAGGGYCGNDRRIYDGRIRPGRVLLPRYDSAGIYISGYLLFD